MDDFHDYLAIEIALIKLQVISPNFSGKKSESNTENS